MRRLIQFTSLAVALAIGASALAAGKEPRAGRLAVSVKDGAWGAARVEDVERVLSSVANVLLPHFPQRASDRIVVEYSREGPRALFEKLPDGAYRVLLNVQDTRWDQFAYQFSHELCHIFTNFDHREIGRGTSNRSQQWFEEALCEAVSLYALGQLASSWERSPPHPGWEQYAPAFHDYANRLLGEGHRQMRPKETIAQWYRANQMDLDGNPYLREKNELLATRLLALLESTPGGLEAIGYLNLEGSSSATSLRTYLDTWYDCCPERYRGFIGKVIALFEERGATVSTAAAF